MSQRPSLNTLIGQREPPSQPFPPQARSRGRIQLNVLIPKTLRMEAKIKAMRQGRDLSDVVEELLTNWVADNPIEK
jgi:predicted HicB family RNase H-like nuclease